MSQQTKRLKLAIVTPFLPSHSAPSRYAHSLLDALQESQAIGGLSLLVEDPPAGLEYPLSYGLLPVQVVPCWRTGDWRNPVRIVQQLLRLAPHGVVFTLSAHTNGKGLRGVWLDLLTATLTTLVGIPVVVHLFYPPNFTPAHQPVLNLLRTLQKRRWPLSQRPLLPSAQMETIRPTPNSPLRRPAVVAFEDAPCRSPHSAAAQLITHFRVQQELIASSQRPFEIPAFTTQVAQEKVS